MSPNLQVKSPLRGPGVYAIVQRGQGLKHLSFTVVELGGALKEYTLESGEEELAVDFYPGSVRVEVDTAGGGWCRRRAGVRWPRRGKCFTRPRVRG